MEGDVFQVRNTILKLLLLIDLPEETGVVEPGSQDSFIAVPDQAIGVGIGIHGGDEVWRKMALFVFDREILLVVAHHGHQHLLRQLQKLQIEVTEDRGRELGYIDEGVQQVRVGLDLETLSGQQPSDFALDLGTALVCAGVTALMLYLAGMEMKYLGYAALASLPVLYLMLFRVKWRRDRLLAFINPEADPLGKGFHIIQSLIAVGTGGLHGLGYMEGRQKLFYLPEPHTDYIFANISEELGLIGAVIVVGLFVVLGYRGIRAAMLSKDPFARFLAFGITATILIQAFFNISVVLALVPTKGITLPFVSYGGTSLFIMLALMGVLLNITREIE